VLHVNDQRGLLVVHPDEMVSPTRVAESFPCERKSVLGDLTNGVGIQATLSAAAVWGNLRHECIEVSKRLDGPNCMSLLVAK
jgi:hypothetical protein